MPPWRAPRRSTRRSTRSSTTSPTRARAGRGRRPRRPVQGGSVPAQGPRCRQRGGTAQPRHAAAQGRQLHLPGGHHPGPAFPRRGPDHLRQDEHARARDRRHDRAEGMGGDAQPLGHVALRRRLERRLGSGRGGGDRPDGPCQRRGRFDPHPRLQQRPRRAEDDPAADQRGTDDRRCHVRRHGRALRSANGPRHRRLLDAVDGPLPATPTSPRRRSGATSRS